MQVGNGVRIVGGLFRNTAFGSGVGGNHHNFPCVVVGSGSPAHIHCGGGDVAHCNTTGYTGTGGFCGEAHLAGIADFCAAIGADVCCISGGRCQSCKGVESVGNRSPSNLVQINDTSAAINFPCGLAIAGSPRKGSFESVNVRNGGRSGRKAVAAVGHDFQLDLVFNGKAAVCGIGSAYCIVISGVAIDIHGAVVGAGENTTSKSTAIFQIRIKNKAKVAYAVIIKRRI